MKKTLLTLAAMLCMTLGMAQNPGAQAGQGGPQGQRPQRLTVAEVNTRMQEELKLDDAQFKQVEKLNKKYSTLYEGMAMGGGAMGGGRPGGGRPMGGGGGMDMDMGGGGAPMGGAAPFPPQQPAAATAPFPPAQEPAAEGSTDDLPF